MVAAANSWGNVLDNALCILFAYCTNRAFVFRSKTTGKAMAKEFGTFVTCRLGTMVLDAAITSVSEIEREKWEDSDTYGCRARVTIMHNMNPICEAYANADAGNGGYYYSIASFIVTMPGVDEEGACEFANSEFEFQE